MALRVIPSYGFRPLAVIAGLALAGCVTGPAIEPQPAIEADGAAKRYALHAGVYYSPQVLQATFTRVGRLEAGFLDRRVVKRTLLNIPLGPPTVRLYNEVLRQLFEDVTRVETTDAEELASKGIDLLVVPSLEHFDLPRGFAKYRPNEHAIGYRTTLRNKTGQPIASWAIFGTAEHSATNAATDLAQAYLNRLTEAYVMDAKQKLLAGFDPEAASALAAMRAEAHSASSGLGNVTLTAKAELFPGVPETQAARLHQLGIVGVRVTALSTADRELVIRASDMRLRLADDRLIEPAPLSAVVQVWQRIASEGGGVRKPGAVEAASNAIGAMVDPVGHIVGDAIFGNLSQAHAAADLQQWSYQVLMPASFSVRKLGKGRAEQGFVFFQLSRPEHARDAALTAWIIDASALRGTQVEVRLP